MLAETTIPLGELAGLLGAVMVVVAFASARTDRKIDKGQKATEVALAKIDKRIDEHMTVEEHETEQMRTELSRLGRIVSIVADRLGISEKDH